MLVRVKRVEKKGRGKPPPSPILLQCFLQEIL